MIIDFHTHVAYHKLYPKFFIDGLSLDIKEKLPYPDEENKSRLVEKVIQNLMNDVDCRKLIGQMDESGIDKSVLLIGDFGLAKPGIEFDINAIYTFYHQILLKNPDRFVVFSGIDPRRGKSGIELFEKSIREFKFHGVKLYPPCGFTLKDKDLYPYYEICAAERLPVLIHSGQPIKNLSDYPNYIEDLEVIGQQFIGVNFVIAHATYSDFENNLRLAKQYKNIYLDISAFQYEYTRLESLSFKLKELIKVVSDKVLFGSDWPLYILSGNQKKWIDLIQNLDFMNNSILEKLFYQNAIKLLNN